MTIDDIDLLEVHDCFSPNEVSYVWLISIGQSNLSQVQVSVAYFGAWLTNLERREKRNQDIVCEHRHHIEVCVHRG